MLQRHKFHESKKRQQAEFRGYGQRDCTYADKLMEVETARIKIKIDKLNIKQAKREQKMEQSMGMTNKIFGTMSRFNPDFDDPAKGKIPFGSQKGRIGQFHEQLKTIDANMLGGMGASPREKAVQMDHQALATRGGNTGRFRSGLSVPKARPTMFWEKQEVDVRFDVATFEASKDERENKHAKKKLFLLEK